MIFKNTVGIIGGGRIAKVHALTLRNHFPGIKIKYVSEPYITPQVSEWVKEYGVENLVEDADVMLEDDSVDCVFICSPTPSHCDYVIRAAEKGKHIYCEKPIGSNIPEVKKAAEAVSKAGVSFLMGFMRRFDDNHTKIKQAVESGVIGTPNVIKMVSRDPVPPPIGYTKTSGGFYFDSMVHDFDLARYYTGSEITEVYAIGKARIEPELEDMGHIDTAICTITFDNGAIGVIDLCRKSGCGYDQRTEVLGSKACIQMENVNEGSVIIRNETGVIGEKPVYFFLERYEKCFVNAQKAFFESVNSGKPTPVTIFDGLQSLRLANAAQKSFEENRPVKLSEIE